MAGMNVFNPGGGAGGGDGQAAAPKRLGPRDQSRKMLADALADPPPPRSVNSAPRR